MPAHSPEGQVPYPHLLRVEGGTGSRRTNLLPVTCPFLSREAVDRTLRAYAPYREQLRREGIDHIMAHACRGLDLRVVDFCEIVKPHREKNSEGKSKRSSAPRLWPQLRNRFPLPGATGAIWSQPLPWMEREQSEEIARRIEQRREEGGFSPTGLRMLEIGAGGSTFQLASLVEELISVEHSAQWARELWPWLPGHVTLLHVPTEREVGEECRRGIQEDFASYLEVVGQLSGRFDFVLIDGRVRAECARLVVPLLKEEALVFFHDWERPRYRWVLLFYQCLTYLKGKQAGLAVLRAKPEGRKLCQGRSEWMVPFPGDEEAVKDDEEREDEGAALVEEILREMDFDPGLRVLEVEGRVGETLCRERGWRYSSLHSAHTGEAAFNGRDLPGAENAFDLVLLRGLLHRVPENAIALLEQASRVAENYVLVEELLNESHYPRRWQDALHERAPGGLYRSDEEWRQLFWIAGMRAFASG
ncbi:hypothetical protein [Roseibacillus ishigakijimensis]|uniref:hypothetical protein n=1 Tax=Roseibacillus ishigakijimensis TaxID=454146 RepID=UPI003637B696